MCYQRRLTQAALIIHAFVIHAFAYSQFNRKSVSVLSTAMVEGAHIGSMCYVGSFHVSPHYFA
jgi:hypothetical protein